MQNAFIELRVSHSMHSTFTSGTLLTITHNSLTGKFDCRCGKSYSSSHSIHRHKAGCYNTANAEELSTGEMSNEEMQMEFGDDTFENDH
jgi:hypothetical protein